MSILGAAGCHVWCVQTHEGVKHGCQGSMPCLLKQLHHSVVMVPGWVQAGCMLIQPDQIF